MKDIVIYQPQKKHIPIGFISDSFFVQILSPTIHIVEIMPYTEDQYISFIPDVIEFGTRDHFKNLTEDNIQGGSPKVFSSNSSLLDKASGAKKESFIEKNFQMIIKKGTKIGEHVIRFKKRE